MDKQQKLRDQLYLRDTDLARQRTFVVDGVKLAGIDGKPTDGSDNKIKVSRWNVVRETVVNAGTRLTNLGNSWDAYVKEDYPKLSAQIAERQQEVQKVLERTQEIEGRFKVDIERLEKQLAELQEEKKKAETAKRDRYSSEETKTGQHESSIRSLLELELRWLRELEADGEILEVASEHNFVVVNIGRADKVFPGLRLEVFNDDRGRYLEKGMLEVVDVRPSVAIARVLTEIDRKHYPLARGDRVGNPIFSTGTPKVFVLAGEFKRFNKENLEDFIRATGGQIRQKLEPGVDFVVAGDHSDKVQDHAREYQVQAMTESQVLKYVQANFDLAK